MDIENYKRAIDALEIGCERRFPDIRAEEFDYSVRRVRKTEELVAHLKTMLPKMREFLAENRLSKLNRWLGFAQGIALVCGLFSLNELRRVNTPSNQVFVEK